MVREISIHYDDIVARRKLHTVHICRAKSQLASAGLEVDVGCISFRELVSDDLGAIWRAVVNDNEFPVKITMIVSAYSCGAKTHGRNRLLSKGAIEEPGDDGKVAPLVVCWQDHRVLVLGDWRHDELFVEISSSTTAVYKGLKRGRVGTGRGF